jgi:tRNA intron endonuclease, catalytic C-terminal domain
VKKIKIFLHSDAGLVWSFEEADYIQINYRIVGVLVGNSPLNSREKSLPFRLAKEQIRLLLSLNACTLLTTEYSIPSAQQILEHGNQKESEYFEWEIQKELYSLKMKDIFLGLNPENVIKPSKPILPIAYETNSLSLPWCHTKEIINLALSSEEMKKFKIFNALWGMGWFIGCGSKFGSEYLLYGSDPSTCHSSIIVSCGLSLVLNPRNLIGQSRIGTAVKKVQCFCSWDEDKDQLVILTSIWTSWA